MILLETKMAKENSNSGARWFPVYQGLCEAVVGHSLLPGTKLPEDELASIYTVSRAWYDRPFRLWPMIASSGLSQTAVHSLPNHHRKRHGRFSRLAH